MKQGWETMTLGEIASFSQGIQVGLEDHLTEPKEGYVRFIRIVDYTQNTNDIRYIPYPGEKYFVSKEDIVMVRYGTPGLIGRGKAGVIANNLFRIKIERNDLTNDYLSLFLSQEHIQNYLSSQGSATMPALNFGQLKTVEINFPILSAQRRIVALINQAFAAIDKAKANTEKNLQNVRELFESYLQGVFEKNVEDWEKKTLKELTTHLGDGLHGTPKYTSEGDYYFINGNNLTEGGIEFKSSTKRVSFEEYNKHKKNLTDRTILVSINGTLGNVAFYNNEKIILGKSACYFNLKEGIDKNYIKYVLSSSYFLAYAHKEATGATIKNVSLKTMREFIIPLPSLKKQKAIVENLEALSDETRKLEDIYRQKVNYLEELKKSFLQKAFNGELNTEKAIAI